MIEKTQSRIMHRSSLIRIHRPAKINPSSPVSGWGPHQYQKYALFLPPSFFLPLSYNTAGISRDAPKKRKRKRKKKIRQSSKAAVDSTATCLGPTCPYPDVLHDERLDSMVQSTHCTRGIEKEMVSNTPPSPFSLCQAHAFSSHQKLHQPI